MSEDVYVHTGGRDGTGPPIVFLHGAGLDHTSWRFQSRWLAARDYRVLAPDLPGHGASRGPAHASVEESAAWLAGFLAATTRDEPVTLVGHSMGSLISLETAAAHPHLVARLVLVGSAAEMKVHPDLMAAARHDGEVAGGMIAGWSFGPAFGGGHPEPGTWEQGAISRLIARSSAGVLAADLAACQAYDPAPAARRVTVPTLVVAGSDDRMTPGRGAAALVELLAAATLTILPGAGHEPMVEMPPRFNALLRNFVESGGKASSR